MTGSFIKEKIIKKSEQLSSFNCICELLSQMKSIKLKCIKFIDCVIINF